MGKATALPAFAWYDVATKKFRVQIAPALKNYPRSDAEKDAKKLNQSLEQLIKQHPEQYMWTMKWFRTRPKNEPALYR